MVPALPLILGAGCCETSTPTFFLRQDSDLPLRSGCHSLPGSLSPWPSRPPSSRILHHHHHQPPSTFKSHLIDLFRNLHTSDPNHAIFGPPTTGLLRLPLTSRRKNGQSWTNVAKKIAGWVLGEMGDKFSEKGCWMSRQYQIQITETNGAARPVILRQFLVCRLLAFLVDPSDEHWRYLDNGGIQHPFSHACGRGGKRSDGQTAFCINAVYHGRFETPAVNESRKTLCTNGARVLCPGHGTPATKCIFTHPDGVPQPCRNNDTMVPDCSCPRRCYG